MTTLGFILPGGPLPRTGGTLYNLALIDALDASGHAVLQVPLTGTWPLPTPPQLDRMVAPLSELPPGLPLLVDGLLWTGLGPLLPRLTLRHPCTVLVHSPLFRETGLTRAEADHLRAAEAHALQAAHACIATGSPTLTDLHGFHLQATCVLPGTAPAQPVSASDPHALLSVATITPRKGHDRLLRALSTLTHLPWHLTCAGSTTTAPAWFAHIRALVAALHLGDRVHFAGELDAPALDHAYGQAGLLVHGAHYEAYGMAIAEALVRGIPVVTTAAGARTPAVEAATRLLPADPTTWSPILQAAMGPHHTALRAAARAVRLPSWSDAARAILAGLAVSR